MAQDLKPSTWIPGWSENGTAIAVADLAAAFPEMTAAEADATTGDIRKVMFAICEQIYNEFNDLPVADRPTKMTVYRSTSVNDQTGITVKTYQFRFEVAVAAQDVADEES